MVAQNHLDAEMVRENIPIDYAMKSVKKAMSIAYFPVGKNVIANLNITPAFTVSKKIISFLVGQIENLILQLLLLSSVKPSNVQTNYQSK